MINGHFNKRTADNLFLSMGTTFSYKKLSKEQTLLINGHIIFLHRKCALIRVSTVYLEKKIEIISYTYRYTFLVEVHLLFEPQRDGVRQVREKVDDATARGRYVCLGEEHTDQKRERDGGHGEHE